MLKAQHVVSGRGGTRRWLRMLLAALVAIVVTLALTLLPLPFVVHSPGPTFNVLGTQNGERILQVEGGSQDTSGELRLVTISELGGPGSTVTLPALLQAWVSPGYSVKPYGDVYPARVSAEQLQQVSAAQMESSHSTASVAALEHLGYELPTVITIEGVVEGSGSEGKIVEGDELVSLQTPDGAVHQMNSPSAPFVVLKTVPIGSDLVVTVKRDGELVEQTVTTTGDPNLPEEDQEGSKLGILLGFDIDMPVEITYHLEKIGGPSAGMVFALAIIDELTGGTLTGGEKIAGTGAIHYDGTVEPIGGVTQKMYAAKRDGAEWFLAPAANCAEAAGNEPEGLRLLAAGTLAEAVRAVELIAEGRAGEALTCETVLADSGK